MLKILRKFQLFCASALIFSGALSISLGSAAGEVKVETKTETNVEPTTDQMKQLKTVVARYSAADTVKMNVEKEVTSKLMSKTRTSKGDMSIVKPGKFRLNIEKPDRSLVIVNGKNIWIVEYPIDPEFDNTTRVLISDSPDKMQTPALMTFLLGKGSLLDHYKVVSAKEEGTGQTRFELVPTKDSADVAKLLVLIDMKNKLIQELSVVDQLENKTQFTFKNTKFGSEISKDIFNFKPPKNADVTRI